MRNFHFKSFVIAPEINLNKIASYFGINKKFKWEEPLVLDEKYLKGVIPQPEDKNVYIFHFGSIVCINLAFHEIKDIVSYLKKIDENLNENINVNRADDFHLYVDEKASFELNYNSVTVTELKKPHLDIISTILAKSIALEKIEEDIDLLLDDIEKIIIYLDKGHLNISDEKLAKTSAKVLRFKYNTLSYIMILEKPDLAWTNEHIEDFYVELSDLFELKDRYEKIRHKTEVLLDITEVFSGLTHSKRGTRLEWMVIILILIELAVSLFDKIIPLLK